MGQPGECLEAPLIQFVNLYRGADKVPMGKREAQFVTLRQLREEVGNDACRFFYLMRSHDQPLDFDLELAKSRSNENPVYYIQYAHARVASVMKQLAARGLAFEREAGLSAAERLASPHEQALLKSLTRYPEILEQAAVNRAPHTLAHYLPDLANEFHSYYHAQAFIAAAAPLRNGHRARVRQVRLLRDAAQLRGRGAGEGQGREAGPAGRGPDRAPRGVRAAGGLIPQRGGCRPGARAARAPGGRRQGTARRGGQRRLASRAHRADHQSRRAQQGAPAAAGCRGRCARDPGGGLGRRENQEP